MTSEKTTECCYVYTNVISGKHEFSSVLFSHMKNILQVL